MSLCFPLLRVTHLCSVSSNNRFVRDVAKEEGVSWLRHLVLRWGARNFSLACPHCRHPASSLTFRRARFMLGEEELVCEECGEASVVTFWRFEGLSCRSDRTQAIPDSRH